MKNRNRFVYLAGPIDQVTFHNAVSWRESAANVFSRHGFGCFSPAHAYKNVERSTHGKAIQYINYAAIASSQLMFTNITEDMSIGTIREIEVATQWKVPVYLFTTNVGVRDKLTKSFMTVDCCILKSSLMGDAVDEIIQYENVRALHVPMVESEENENGS